MNKTGMQKTITMDELGANPKYKLSTRKLKTPVGDNVFSSARDSRISNYTSATHNKPLPFNAIRYIALHLKRIKEKEVDSD